MVKDRNRKKQILNHLGKVGMAVITFNLMASSLLAVDPPEITTHVVGAEGIKQVLKQVLNGALKITKSKLITSAAIFAVCVPCISTLGAVASPGLCIACWILITKTID